MPDLILDSLEIQNFRGLKELRIERLGRVNLIVGKNNVGKTSVLEALRLYAFPGSLEILRELLVSRDQFDPESTFWSSLRHRYHLPLEKLFYWGGGDNTREFPPTIISIGKIGARNETLSIYFDHGPESASLLLPPGYFLIFEIKGRRIPVSMFSQDPIESIRFRDQVQRLGMDSSYELIPCSSVSMNGLNVSQVEWAWNSVALTKSEDDVIEAMRLVSPDVERLVLKPIDQESKGRVPFVKLDRVNDPVTLRSLGDGMGRIFGIALALVNAKNGLLLIDEIENGLHYSVQPDVWRFLFQTATKLNVQVFATTHSYDCIKSFEEAARESEEEGVLIRLAQKAGRIFVGEFDERDLKIAVEGQIEVR